jgi:adenine-specific DNA-methyltransferase
VKGHLPLVDYRPPDVAPARTGERAGARYIGSKVRIVGAIARLIALPAGARFADLFSGTGVVARAFAKIGHPVLLNDHLISATYLSLAEVLAMSQVPMGGLGGYRAALHTLNMVRGNRGFVYQQYSPADAGVDGPGRRYFTPANAARIDAARRQIEEWYGEGVVTWRERALLVADLLVAANGVANTAGTYGCYMQGWRPNALRELELRPRSLLDTPVQIDVRTGDVFDVPVADADVVYLDPPYTKRQYAAYYHILETIAAGDAPAIGGLTGLRPWRDKASDYCYKRRALPALLRLVSSLSCERTYLSYGSQGHVQLDELTNGLRTAGHRVVVHDLGLIGRYRPNAEAVANSSSVNEFLVEIGPIQ